MEPPELCEGGYYTGPREDDLELMPIVTELINTSTNKAYLLMMLKKYRKSDENSIKIRQLLNARLQQLRGK